MSQIAYLLVNFGGPRTLEEVEPFLRALLTDKDVIRTNFPQPIHNFLFNRIAKRRSQKVAGDYAKIGGGSPIWSDTEYLAAELEKNLQIPILTFHRYLPSTHKKFFISLNQLKCDEVRVFPLFPQFTYATTGSIARLFSEQCSSATLSKLRWVKSYPTHPAYIRILQKCMQECLDNQGIKEEEIFCLFSAHGLPQRFIEEGDLYQYECQLSYQAAMQKFTKAESILCYQSKFGRGVWLQPYTDEVCQQINNYISKERKYCLFIPLSFTSDHIETLFEVEELYMPLISKKGLHPLRMPAFNRRPDWIHAIIQILHESSPCTTSMLVRP